MYTLCLKPDTNQILFKTQQIKFNIACALCVVVDNTIDTRLQEKQIWLFWTSFGVCAQKKMFQFREINLKMIREFERFCDVLKTCLSYKRWNVYNYFWHQQKPHVDFNMITTLTIYNDAKLISWAFPSTNETKSTFFIYFLCFFCYSPSNFWYKLVFSCIKRPLLMFSTKFYTTKVLEHRFSPRELKMHGLSSYAMCMTCLCG